MIHHAGHYRPVFDAIREKLVAETRRRARRSVETWIIAERRCVMAEVNRQREQLAYAPVVLADVERIERLALGHADYVSKYAHAATDLVFSKDP